MQPPAHRFSARLVALVRADPAGIGAGFVALIAAGVAGLVAGLTLAAATETLEELPGLLVLVPPAIAMRGSIFGALGSRLGTAIHTGVFQVRFGRDTLLGQNAVASLALSFGLSAVLAVYAKVVAQAFGVTNTISIADFLVVSIVGGMIASVVVLVIAVVVAALSARHGWDLDNVAAPVVTSSGDVVALPALILATRLTEIPVLTPLLATLLSAAAVAVVVVVWRSRRPITRSIMRQSSILLVTGAVSTIAGVTIEHQVESFLVLPVLLVLLPPFLGLSGSLGGILAARLSTKLHLGLVEPNRSGLSAAADDMTLVVGYALCVFTLLGAAGFVVGDVFGHESPGFADVLGVTVVAGLIVTVAVLVVAFVAAVSAHRLGADPDNFGIPVITSTLDLLGAFAFVLAVGAFGLT